MLDAISGKTTALATVADLYTAKATLVIGADLAEQQPLLAFQIRANFRHHAAHTYTVTSGPVRERKFAVASLIAKPGEELSAVESLREQLAKESELVIVFGDAIKGDAVRKLVAFGDSLGIPVKYVCLVDYSNSRGAVDMGLIPGLLPGYHTDSSKGLATHEILAAADLDVLWVIGANPLKSAIWRRRTRLSWCRRCSSPKPRSVPTWSSPPLPRTKRTAPSPTSPARCSG